MKRVLGMALLLAVLGGLSPAEAVTVNGRATPGGTPTWSIFHGPGGMLIITVYWKTRNSLLFLVGSCDDGASFVSGSMADRFTQVQIEVDPNTSCEVEARSRRGTSKFWMNVQGSGIFGFSGTRDAIVVTRSERPAPVLDALVELGKNRPPE